MDGKHTPGPWRPAEGSYGHYVAVKAGKKTIARIPWGDGDWCNTCLIASAPDLLAALRDVVDAVEYAGKAESYKAATYGLLLGILPKIRAAIARAEGKE